MNDTPDIEHQLSSGLRNRAGTPYDPTLGLDALNRGRARLRRRSVTGTLVAAGAAVALIAGVSLAATALSNPSRDRTPPPAATSAAPSPDATPDVSAAERLFEWALALPLGDAPAVPYLVGNVVRFPGGVNVTLPASSAKLVGAGPRGAVVLLEDDENPVNSRYALVSRTGAVTDLGDTRITNAQDALVDPTGRLFTNGDEIIDLASQAVVGEIPRDAVAMMHWTSAGIVYLTDRGTTLWDPSTGREHRISGHPGQPTKGSDAFVAADGGCAELVTAGPDGFAPARSLCGTKVLATSSDGAKVITPGLGTIDDSGDAVALAGSPNRGRPYQPDVRWLGSGRFLISLGEGDDKDATGSAPVRALLITCDVDRRSCTRAIDPVDVPRGQGSVQLP
ncbi:hypothetical protein [Pimelobacter simplex]|uniref:hypothetical protein n=1 Tax=Nocardioides simplex TaxID=2045 RepID=UPI003AAE110A